MSDDEEGRRLGFSPSEWRSIAMVEGASAPRGLPVSNSPELQRVLDLPRRAVVTPTSPTAEALVELGMRKYSRGPRACGCAGIDRQVAAGNRTCITRFKWEQAWMLYETELVGGLIANCPVGAGKTLCNIIAPLALRDYVRRASNGTRDLTQVVLLVPPSLLGQIKNDYLLIAEHFRVPGVRVHLQGNRVFPRDPLPAPGGGYEPMLHIISYNALSGMKNSDLLERLRPDAVIADEVDALKDMNSSRTMRVMRYFENHEATTLFCGWTGSLTDNSVREFAHLACLALRLGSPLPVQRKYIDEWSGCLDAVPSPSPPGALIRLLNPGEGYHEIRKAFRRRLAETPGFIMIEGRQIITTRDGRNVTVDVCERVAPPVPPKVDAALMKVRDWLRPDTLVGGEQDEILVDRLERARCAREVASGMFYKFIFPRGESLELRMEWFAKRKEWHSELREKVLRGDPYLDSRKLCENAAMRAWGDAPRAVDVNGRPMLPDWKAKSWPAWREIMDKVEPVSKAERLDSFLVDDAAKWAYEHANGQCELCAADRRGGVIWYVMREFAAWVQQRALELYGLRLPIYGEGSGEDIVEKEDGKRSIIASLKSHGRGRNGLQFMFHHQLGAQSPANARMWQQWLGRMHRRGQERDVVRTEIYLHTEELEESFEQALRRGEYVEQIAGEKQKLLDGWEDDRDDD